ncbi:phosphotransferase [Bacillus sp. FJAT-45350]|uniref:phosphotransferase n=1 Tax=Bacillus sp. FJAT-45350 TaxID=2011014 RepID=UPI00359CA662
MEMFLEEGWQVKPAGGATGEAYIAQHGEQKLFLKRNSSPFLAVLSAEGIVPKLLWTKRLENGDVITAQRWVNGRELKSYEMNESLVAKLLSKIHRSSELLDMFKRIGNRPLTPCSIIAHITVQLELRNITDPIIEKGLLYLSYQKEQVNNPKMVVCHCDVHHNNWVLGEDGNLFLIDWDGATVADPALDLGLLLYLYIPPNKWGEWLEIYGEKLTDSLHRRMHWYVVSQTIYIILWHKERGEDVEVAKWEEFLTTLL